MFTYTFKVNVIAKYVIMITFIIISVLVGLAPCQQKGLPSREEMKPMKRMDESFFSGLRYHGDHVIFVEAGFLHVEKCSWTAALPRHRPRFQWLGPNGVREVKKQRFKVLSSGDLVMNRPSVRDSGVYVCQVSSRDHHHISIELHHHTIVVFTASAWLRETHLHFLVPSCSQKFKEHLVEAIHNFLCHHDIDCLYTIQPHQCSSSPDSHSLQELRVSVHMRLHHRFSLLLPRACGIECVNNASQAELASSSQHTITRMRTHMRLAFREKSEVLLLEKKTSQANVAVCGSGLKLHRQKVCVPCDKGEARKAGLDSHACVTCGLLTYSASFGQTSCHPCPLFKVALSFGSYRKEDCVWFFFSAFTMVMLVLAALAVSLLFGLICSLFVKGTEERYQLCKYICNIFCLESESSRDKRIKAEHKAFMEEMKRI